MSNQIRILHCVAGMNMGGYENFIMNVYRNIDRDKIQFDFISSFDGFFDNEIISLGGKIYKIPFITQVGPFAYAKEVKEIFKNHPEYKIVHSHMDKFSGLIMEIAKKCGVETRIAHSHSTGNEGGFLFNIVKNYYGKKILPNATDLFQCSSHAGKWLFLDKANEAIQVNNGIDIKKFSYDIETSKAVKKELNIENETVFGHIGRFCLEKNQTFLLDIFKEIVKQNNNSVLLLIGEGNLQDKVKAKACELGIAEKVLFLNIRTDTARLSQCCDVFLFPSLHEGLPVTLVEAQSAWLQCVVSDVVTTDIDVCNKITYLSLSDTPLRWATVALEKAKLPKTEPIGIESFDVKNTIKQLTDFYISHS
ncbi:MAG: glycosyltransferase family 1 protein [Oscillospiraceae bacterium]